MFSNKFLILLFILLALVSAIEMEFEVDDALGKDALPSSIIKAVNNAYEMNKKGIEELEKGQLDLAMDYFDKALEIYFDYSDAQNNRGVVYYRKGNVPAAKDIWEKLSVKDPSYAVSSYNMGLVCMHEKQRESAIRLFERAIKADPKFVEAFVRNGMTYLQLGRNEDAIKNLKAAYKIAPEHQDAWLFLSYGMVNTGDTSGAVAILRKHENSIEALKMLGNIESSRKNSKKAIDYFQKAINKGAESSILINYASTLYDDGNCKEAIRILETFFTNNLKVDQDAYLIAGLASKECGNLTAALKYFEQGCLKYPDDQILQHNLGQMYFQQKQFDKAQQVWNNLPDTVQDPSILYLRAISARKTGDMSGAENYIQKALEFDDRSEFHDFLGVILHQKGNDDAAETEFRKALKINPENRSAQLDLALISRKGEDLGAAVNQFELQLKNCTGDSCAEHAFALSIIYFQKKEIEKAIRTLLSVQDKHKDERIYRHIAIYHRELHQYDSAINILEQAHQKLILDIQTEYELAESYLLAGYYNKANERLMALLPKWKQNPWRLYYQMGYAFMEQNDLEKAKDYFEKSIKSKRENIAARGLLAFVHNLLGNSDEARALWEKNIKDDPSNPSLWINMGLSFEREGNYKEALSYYQRAEILKKGDKELQINIGNAYAGLDRYTEAIDAYTIALSTSKRELAGYNIFLIARKRKDKERAISISLMLEKEFPMSVYTKRVRSEMNLWNGDTASALNVLENISEKDNADFLALASIYASKGNGEKTLQYLQKVSTDGSFKKEISGIEAQLAFKKGEFSKALSLMSQTGDTSFAAQYNIALVSYNAGRFGEALANSERLSINATGSDRADCCRLAGNAAFALKKWKQARQWYLQLSGIEATNSIVQYNLSVAYYNLGEIETAWKYYQRAKEMDTTIFNKDIEMRYKQITDSVSDTLLVIDSVDSWYNRAVELQNEGKDTAAEKLYKKVLEEYPNHSLSWNNLGALYGARGDIDNAENSYWKAIEKKHDIPETYINLINLYIELEEFVKARQWIIKGIGHNPDNEQLLQLREKVAEAEKVTQQVR